MRTSFQRREGPGSEDDSPGDPEPRGSFLREDLRIHESPENPARARRFAAGLFSRWTREPDTGHLRLSTIVRIDTGPCGEPRPRSARRERSTAPAATARGSPPV